MTKFTYGNYNKDQVAALPDDMKKLLAETVVYLNDVYQVAMRTIKAPFGWPAMFHLSIKRLDKEPIHDWRDLQLIKNELVGEQHEGVEIYPAEERLVDSANQYHLWVFTDPSVRLPFGFDTRLVVDAEEIEKLVPNAKQRAFN